MPRVLLATDAEGNAKVVTIPSPRSESDEDECDDARTAARTSSVVASRDVALVSSLSVASSGAVREGEVDKGGPDALTQVAGASANDEAEFVMVPAAGEEEAASESASHVQVSTPQEYWAARGFSPLVALVLEECNVSPALVEPGAPQDEMGVLATTQPFFGVKSAAVTSRVAAVYGQSLAARVVHTTRVATDSWTACDAGGPGDRRIRRGGRSDGGGEAAAQAARVVQSGERTAQQVERDRVAQQATLLLELLPDAQMHKAFGFDEEEWSRVPQQRRSALVQAHLGTFSEGALRGSRLALQRLRRWLVANFFPEAAAQFKCSGGLLAWWAQDEQAKSRSKSGGHTVPNSLRDGCVFAARNLALPLDVDAPVFKSIGAAPSKAPVPALSATVAILYHFVSLGNSQVELVRLYSAGIVLSMLAALRLKDAQRASVEFRAEYLVGSCFSSKHPKRRQPVIMPFFSPSEFEGVAFAEPLRSACPKGPDYMFPAVRVPRGADVTHPAASRLGVPAKTSDVIKVMRFLLTQEPLNLTKEQASRYSGHSLRHFMPTLARLFGFPKEDRDELARWAPTPEGRGQRRSMSNMYAQEAECGRVLGIVRKLLDNLSSKVRQLGGSSRLPAQGGWHLFDTPESGVDLAGLAEAGAEPSSSEEDSDDG